MRELFKTSIEEVFNANLGMKAEPCKSRPRGEGYLAQIPFSDGERSFVAEVWVQKKTLEKMAGVLLFDDAPDAQTLEDLVSELGNFIVGHAKMVASDRNLPYKMGTPRFVGVGPLPAGKKPLLYKVEGRCVAIFLKDADG